MMIEAKHSYSLCTSSLHCLFVFTSLIGTFLVELVMKEFTTLSICLHKHVLLVLEFLKVGFLIQVLNNEILQIIGVEGKGWTFPFNKHKILMSLLIMSMDIRMLHDTNDCSFYSENKISSGIMFNLTKFNHAFAQGISLLNITWIAISYQKPMQINRLACTYKHAAPIWSRHLRQE
jgi:hypothetical protein